MQHSVISLEKSSLFWFKLLPVYNVFFNNSSSMKLIGMVTLQGCHHETVTQGVKGRRVGRSEKGDRFQSRDKPLCTTQPIPKFWPLIVALVHFTSHRRKKKIHGAIYSFFSINITECRYFVLLLGWTLGNE